MANGIIATIVIAVAVSKAQLLLLSSLLPLPLLLLLLLGHVVGVMRTSLRRGVSAHTHMELSSGVEGLGYLAL